MQYEADTPEAYLDSLDDDWRKQTLLTIRENILSAHEDMTEYMEYGMLGYAVLGKPVFNLNAQRQYVSFYVGKVDRIDPQRTLMPGLSCGKGCIRFTKTKGPETVKLQAFIQKAVSLKLTGENTGCC